MMEPTIKAAPLPEHVLGYTDGDTIYLDDQLLDVDREIVLRHELSHYYRGHDGHCLTVIEHGINRELACEFIRLDDLGEAAAWSNHVLVIADELDVMPLILEHRLHTLTPSERRALDARLVDAHWAD
ncbi:MAG: hypothetical protein ACTH6N_08610 [Brachybacterium tyrofermentans]|uniref:hypothetical protein n=1 Tax=Brachybacterium tyrofermentans TaxID=47848 RepID=UPI00186723AA|nr:hypothetical protein [Brachybacterium tyrofermentans]